MQDRGKSFPNSHLCPHTLTFQQNVSDESWVDLISQVSQATFQTPDEYQYPRWISERGHTGGCHGRMFSLRSFLPDNPEVPDG